MAKPTAKPITLVEVNTRLANSRSGMTGSAARRSTATKAATRITAATPRPMISAEPHG